MTIKKQPVLFLFFNREDTALKVFKEICKYKPKQLFLASDGPRKEIEGENEKVLALRSKILALIDWPCEINQRFLDTNNGCKDAVSSAIDWLFDNVEEGIILEDDCLPSPSFFDFCSQMLKKYHADDRIMMITGLNYHLDMSKDIDTTYFFSRNFTIWGWATWRRAWRKYDKTISSWDLIKKNKHHYYINPTYSSRTHYQYLFDLVRSNKMNTWDIQWEYSCLFQYGLCIVPHKNLISNIGVDGTHDSLNTSSSLFFPTFEVNNLNIIHPNLVYPNHTYEVGVLKQKHNKTVILITIKNILNMIGLLRPLLFIKHKMLSKT